MKYEGENELLNYRALIARHHDSLNIKAGIERLDIRDPAERDEREEGKKPRSGLILILNFSSRSLQKTDRSSTCADERWRDSW